MTTTPCFRALMVGLGIAALLVSGQHAAAQTNAPDVNAVRERAQKGDPTAQFELGIMYRQGKGVPADSSLAVDWFRKAAAQSNTEAMIQLATMYGTGRGVPSDESQAVFWFHQAAELGDPSAQFNLGGMYVRGQGVVQNYVEAYKWESVAVTRAPNERDRAQFIEARDMLAKQLTADQLAEANKAAEAWMLAFARKKQ